MISKIGKTAFRIMNAAVNSFKYLRNPSVMFEIPFKKEITIITKSGENITINRRKFPAYIEVFQNGWSYEDGTFKKGDLKFKVPDAGILLEDFKSMYMYVDLKDKNVLDIGGLYGESSVFFVKVGKANHVFVYEPIKENQKLVKENIALNNCQKNIIPYEIGVSNKSGTAVIESSAAPGSGGFGLPGNLYKVEIKVESWDTVMRKHAKDNIFLAKVDCEGGEKYLLNADPALIKQIPNWVIETHSTKIERNIIELFEKLGYKKILKESITEEVRVWAFSKTS